MQDCPRMPPSEAGSSPRYAHRNSRDTFIRRGSTGMLQTFPTRGGSKWGDKGGMPIARLPFSPSDRTRSQSHFMCREGKVLKVRKPLPTDSFPSTRDSCLHFVKSLYDQG